MKIKIISCATKKDITSKLKRFDYLKKQGEIEVYANKTNS